MALINQIHGPMSQPADRMRNQQNQRPQSQLSHHPNHTMPSNGSKPNQMRTNPNKVQGPGPGPRLGPNRVNYQRSPSPKRPPSTVHAGPQQHVRSQQQQQSRPPSQQVASTSHHSNGPPQRNQQVHSKPQAQSVQIQPVQNGHGGHDQAHKVVKAQRNSKKAAYVTYSMLWCTILVMSPS